MKKFTGGCLCGSVRFQALGRPYRVGICHCLDCRKHHGTVFHASAIFPEEAVTIEGETRDYSGRYFWPLTQADGGGLAALGGNASRLPPLAAACEASDWSVSIAYLARSWCAELDVIYSSTQKVMEYGIGCVQRMWQSDI